MMIRDLLEDAFSLLVPGNCRVCMRPLYRGVLCTTCTPPINQFSSTPRCSRCFSEFSAEDDTVCKLCELVGLPFNRIRFLWEYDGLAQEAICAMKYSPSERLVRHLGYLAGKAMTHLWGDTQWDLIVPIPASRESFKKRLFSHTTVLARSLRRAAMIPAPLDTWALSHYGKHPPQASLPHRSRIKNVRRAFRASSHRASGKRVLLVDDVLTTGSTAAAAALQLIQSGATSVDLFVLARSHHWVEFRWSISETYRNIA